ncbi:MAG: response regulator [Burkholderiales bacterium]|nr:response regulator [Burkholderiales bacterium]
MQHLPAGIGGLRPPARLGRCRTSLSYGLLQAIPDPMWMRAPDGRLLVVNEAFEQFTGRSADSLLGQVHEHLPPTEPTALARIEDRMALDQSGVLRSEAHWRHADQRRLLMAQMRVPVRGGPGGLQGVLGLAWDITEQRQREQALRRFRWLADSAAQGFVLCTPRGRVVYANATVQRWLDLPNAEGNGVRHVRRHLDAEGWRLVREVVLPSLLAGEGWSGMLPLLDRHGRRREELLAGATALLDPMGRARYFGLVLTDISERLALESELARARDRAEDANRAKSVFLSNISHEIRTPLNAVLGYAQLLAEDVKLHERAREQVQNIWRAGQRLLRLISEVLDLSKIEAGALQFSLEPVELHAELGEIVQLLQARAAERQVTLLLERHFEAPLTALLDRGKFGQVVLNLLSNALKFSPDRGQVRLVGELREERLHLRVIDQGPGIGAEELAQLFQPFRQGSEGARRGGTGLGLVLSRKLCEAMGGRMWLESQPGQGTQACLELPLRRSQTSAAPTGDHFDSGRWRLRADSRCRVLVAEDDPDSRQFLCSFLEGLGCEVASAADGREALQLAEGGDFDIVLSDMRMPVLDGPGLREALTKRPQSSNWPVVAVTASSLLDNRDHFLAMGFAEYISKPYRFAEVLRALARLGGAKFEPADAGAQEDNSAGLSPSTEPGAPPLSEPEATFAGADIDREALHQALEFARQGRARELRQSLSKPGLVPAALREALDASLARYDLSAAERLLQEFLESL